MKKNLISLAVAASLGATVATAQTIHVSPTGTGEVLMFPFYNADGNNASNFTVVNTTSSVKAVKIRFMEYKNSFEVLDFNVYLSGKDVFAFGVIADPNGSGAAVVTNDNSCTVPALGGANGAFTGTTTTLANGATQRIQPFVNYLPVGAKDFDQSVSRTLTGHIEVIEMGVVGNVTGVTAAQHASFATHDATGVPASCAGLDASWADGAWKTAASSGMTKPTGGLYGVAYHIDVDSAAAFGFEPTAIEGLNAGQVHATPGSEDPSLAGGSGDKAVIYGGRDVGTDKYLELTSPGAGTSVEAISAALMTNSLSNDVVVNSAIGGMTDWVVTFPTKYHHTNTGTTVAVAPFTSTWVGIKKNAAGTGYEEGGQCEPVTINQYDREEAFTANTNGFSPSLAATTTKICNEVAVIAMGATGTASAMNVTTGLTNLGFPYTAGWQKITFKGQNMLAQKGQVATLDGLPAIGFAAYKIANGAMSYGNASEHKTSVAFSGLQSSAF